MLSDVRNGNLFFGSIDRNLGIVHYYHKEKCEDIAEIGVYLYSNDIVWNDICFDWIGEREAYVGNMERNVSIPSRLL